MEDGSWYLWSNRLGDFNPNSTPPSTEGAVAGGSLGFIPPQNDPDIPRDIKVTCNLLGDVRYVWPDAIGGNPVPPRGQFIIKGFSESSRGGNPPIDISFEGIPKAQNSRDVIKGAGIQASYLPATTKIQNVYHPPYKSNSNQPEPFETDWRDIFDIACDGHFLYIVWEAKRPGDNTFDIYATVVTLSTGTVVTGYPKIIDQGRRPTVACDVRNNSNSLNPQVTFDIAYISSIPQFGQAGGGLVMHSATVNGTTNGSIPQPTQFLEPVSQIGFVNYTKPMHARILVASALVAAPPVKAIYVIADDGDNSQTYGNLLFHKIINVNTLTPTLNPQAFYVDGTAIRVHPAPLESGTSNSAYEVWNTPIIAFANPYDGEPNINYDEFHCLYSLDALNSNPDASSQAVHIVRGMNSNIYPSTTETRRLINIKTTNNGSNWSFVQGPDVGQYTGSVNQMGIHVHWAESHGRYYNRDRRAFDEHIEENTLITDTCIVEDGTSHQGTNSITVLPAKRVTLWSDLKYLVGGVAGNQLNKYGNYMNRVGDEICPGNFQPPSFKGEYHAKLFMYGNVSLNIGTGTSTDQNSILTMLPNSQVLYTKSADTTQTIIVKPKSLLDFYGLPGGGATGSIGCKFQNFTYHGKLLLEAAVGSTPGGKILVHGGATLQIQDEITLELKNGSEINFAYEQNLLPPWQTTNPALQNQTTGLNIPATGKMLLNGTFISNSATLTSNLPTDDSALVILVNDALRYTSALPQLQFDANNTSFLCIPSTGRSNMLLKWTSPSSFGLFTVQQYGPYLNL